MLPRFLTEKDKILCPHRGELQVTGNPSVKCNGTAVLTKENILSPTSTFIRCSPPPGTSPCLNVLPFEPVCSDFTISGQTVVTSDDTFITQGGKCTIESANTKNCISWGFASSATPNVNAQSTAAANAVLDEIEEEEEFDEYDVYFEEVLPADYSESGSKSTELPVERLATDRNDVVRLGIDGDILAILKECAKEVFIGDFIAIKDSCFDNTDSMKCSGSIFGAVVGFVPPAKMLKVFKVVKILRATKKSRKFRKNNKPVSKVQNSIEHTDTKVVNTKRSKKEIREQNRRDTLERRGRTGDLKPISSEDKKVIDMHKAKEDYVGKESISKYDMKVDPKGKVVLEPVKPDSPFKQVETGLSIEDMKNRFPSPK